MEDAEIKHLICPSGIEIVAYRPIIPSNPSIRQRVARSCFCLLHANKQFFSNLAFKMYLDFLQCIFQTLNVFYQSLGSFLIWSRYHYLYTEYFQKQFIDTIRCLFQDNVFGNIQRISIAILSQRFFCKMLLYPVTSHSWEVFSYSHKCSVQTQMTFGVVIMKVFQSICYKCFWKYRLMTYPVPSKHFNFRLILNHLEYTNSPFLKLGQVFSIYSHANFLFLREIKFTVGLQAL